MFSPSEKSSFCQISVRLLFTDPVGILFHVESQRKPGDEWRSAPNTKQKPETVTKLLLNHSQPVYALYNPSLSVKATKGFLVERSSCVSVSFSLTLTGSSDVCASASGSTEHIHHCRTEYERGREGAAAHTRTRTNTRAHTHSTAQHRWHFLNALINQKVTVSSLSGLLCSLTFPFTTWIT